ncbi:MAG: hypothetical protein JETCAE03_34580 [Ignavibacteriaceae bacterium]|jgi:hypothetical protein|nr:MAG: hypothetical protein JETCAE03_34580 [Ignavibacteriaceae bacterium]
MTKKEKQNRSSILDGREPFKSSNGVKLIKGHKYNWQVDSNEHLRLELFVNPDYEQDEDYYWGEDPTVCFNVCKQHLDTGVLIECKSFKEAEKIVDRMVKAYKGKYEVAPLYIIS